MKLNISKNLQLPVEFLSLRKVVYGGSGAGKTSFGRVIFEEATSAGVPCGAIDLKGDWYGLKSSSTGNSDGIPVIIFGGEHADVPLDENGGAELAEIVAELRQPFVIDLEEFSKTKQLKFLAPFFDRLYDKNREALVLNCDEADRYIPQRIITKDVNAAICLGAGEDIAKRGRKHGIFPIFFSQRNADLNKSVTELCDVAIVFRTAGPNDQKAVNDWFLAKGNLVTEEQRMEVMNNIAALENGEAIICSAHPHLPMFERVQIRLPRTFDSSATPEIGKQLIKPKKLAHVEISALNERMQSAIEKAKANDPAELRKEISKLKAELRRAQEAKPVVESKTVEVPVFAKDDYKTIKDAAELFDRMESAVAFSVAEARECYKQLNSLAGRVNNHAPVAAVRKAVDRIQVPSRRTPVATLNNPVRESLNGNIGGGMKRMLVALAQRSPLSDRQLGVRAGLSSGSGTFGTYLATLRQSGYVSGDRNAIGILPDGVEALGHYDPLPEGQELLQYWLGKIDGGAKRMLQALASVYPDSMTDEELGVVADISAGSGTFGTYLSTLRTLELITGKRDALRASEEFFQ